MNIKINFLFILFLVLISCKQNKRDESDLKFEENKKINAFLEKANDNFYNNNNRIAFSDSAFVLLNEKENDSSSRKKYFKLANRYFYLNEVDKYKNVSFLINKKALIAKDTFSIAKSYNYIGDYYYLEYKIDSSYYFYLKANKFLNNLTNNDLKLNVNRNIGNLLHYRNNYLESDIYITKVLKLATEIDDFRFAYESYLILGLNQLGLKNYDKSIEYFLKADQVLDDSLKGELFFPTLKAQVYINFCNSYQQMKNYHKMLYYAGKGLSINNFEKIDIKIQAYLKNYYGYAKLKLKNNSANFFFNETLKIGDSLNFIPIQNTSNLHLGEYYLFKKDTTRAIGYIRKVSVVSKNNNLVDDELKALHLLSLTEPNENYHLKRIVFLNDSLIEIERKTRDKFSRIAFETDEIIKEKDIIEVDKNKVSSQRWIIIILSLFFIFFILFYYNLRIQKNKNKELEYIKEQEKSNAVIFELMLDEQKKIEEGKQIEKQRISKELHDGVMGKLTSIRLNLFVLSKKNDQETINKCLSHIDHIQQIEKEIRNIAHDLNKDIFSDNVNFISIVKNIFTSIENHSTIDFKLFIDENIDWESLESNIKMQIYRVLQEALLNIDKYADAKIVTISMKQKNNEIDIEIKDDGKGFDINKPKNGIGLKNMKERIESINGKFKIKSNKNEGTIINLIIPL